MTEGRSFSNISYFVKVTLPLALGMTAGCASTNAPAQYSPLPTLDTNCDVAHGYQSMSERVRQLYRQDIESATQNQLPQELIPFMVEIFSSNGIENDYTQGGGGIIKNSDGNYMITTVEHVLQRFQCNIDGKSIGSMAMLFPVFDPELNSMRLKIIEINAEDINAQNPIGEDGPVFIELPQDIQNNFRLAEERGYLKVPEISIFNDSMITDGSIFITVNQNGQIIVMDNPQQIDNLLFLNEAQGTLAQQDSGRLVFNVMPDGDGYIDLSKGRLIGINQAYYIPKEGERSAVIALFD